MQDQHHNSCRTYSTKEADNTQAFAPLLPDRKRAAAVLSISVRGLDYLIAEGRIPTRQIGCRKLIAVAELVKFANQDRTEHIVPPSSARRRPVSTTPSDSKDQRAA